MAEFIEVVAFKMYLEVSADIRMVSDEDKEFFLILPETHRLLRDSGLPQDPQVPQ
jgi:hypothetical protein